MIFAAGIETRKYARKNAVWISMLSARFRLKVCCANGMSTSFNEVREPHIKNNVVSTTSAGP
jgi:hypothetical protein